MKTEKLIIDLQTGKKIFFISDVHLGVPNKEISLKKELLLIDWINSHEKEMGALFILGDLFDFWFEYRCVVPRGFQRILGRLSSLTDSGIPVYFFKGNHDMWTFGYLENEIGLKVYSKPIRVICNEVEMEVGHGDGLGPGDWGYKLIKNIFSSRITQWMFARLHPNFSMSIAAFFSRWSRQSNHNKPERFISDQQEFLVQYIIQCPEAQRAQVYIFGHRHLIFDRRIDNSHYFNLGEWFSEPHYLEFDGQKYSLKPIGDGEESREYQC